MFSLIRRKQRPLVPPLGNDLLTAKPQRDVFFAGLNYFDNTPLLFDRSESVHSIYYGGTGSGKSASMAFALEQAIHAGDNALVVDLKGLDYMLYAAMCSAAARCGIDPPDLSDFALSYAHVPLSGDALRLVETWPCSPRKSRRARGGTGSGRCPLALLVGRCG